MTVREILDSIGLPDNELSKILGVNIKSIRQWREKTPKSFNTYEKLLAIAKKEGGNNGSKTQTLSITTDRGKQTRISK